MITNSVSFRHNDYAAQLRTVRCGAAACGRVELKYCLSVSVAEAALGIARGHLPPDPLASGPQQRVTSLYLDTARLTFLRWHRDRAVDRFKLRIRRYGDQLGTTFYAEIKHKTRSVVSKCRASFPAEWLAAMCEGAHPERTVATGENSDGSLAEFVRRQRTFGATPKMLITGLRESLRDAATGAALTVDRDLRYQPIMRPDLVGSSRGWQKLRFPSSPGIAVLVELKYSGQPPGWMDGLIHTLSPWRVSFSKYATAMDQWQSSKAA
jgi:hypothetical protein